MLSELLAAPVRMSLIRWVPARRSIADPGLDTVAGVPCGEDGTWCPASASCWDPSSPLPGRTSLSRCAWFAASVGAAASAKADHGHHESGTDPAHSSSSRTPSRGPTAPSAIRSVSPAKTGWQGLGPCKTRAGRPSSSAPAHRLRSRATSDGCYYQTDGRSANRPRLGFRRDDRHGAIAVMARTVDHAARAVRRDAFIEAAQVLIASKGYEALSIQDVLDGSAPRRAPSTTTSTRSRRSCPRSWTR